jgi:hypothetical protein
VEHLTSATQIRVLLVYSTCVETICLLIRKSSACFFLETKAKAVPLHIIKAFGARGYIAPTHS